MLCLNLFTSPELPPGTSLPVERSSSAGLRQNFPNISHKSSTSTTDQYSKSFLGIVLYVLFLRIGVNVLFADCTLYALCGSRFSRDIFVLNVLFADCGFPFVYFCPSGSPECGSGGWDVHWGSSHHFMNLPSNWEKKILANKSVRYYLYDISCKVLSVRYLL